MNESAARRVLLVRAFETTPGSPWSDADRGWAVEQAAHRSGPAAGPERLIEQHSQTATERLTSRDPGIAAVLAATDAPKWFAAALIALGAAAGLAGDAIGSTRHINLLAPPLLALMAWNVVMYGVLAGSAMGRRRAAAANGPLRAALQGLMRRAIGLALPRRRPSATGRFVADWAATGQPLHRARLAAALHLAAAAFALGALASMYWRGLAFEYRAGWDSTFLDPAAVRRILEIVLWPATAFGAMAVPDAARLAELRFSSGPGENAARWIHAYGISVVAVVVLPRLLLAGVAGWRARRLSSHFPLDLQGDYFEALLRRLAAAAPLRADAAVVDTTTPARTIAMSLVSHTNVGKTTLARTLLRRDIGEVRDAEHVTFAAEGHKLAESAAGDRLELWDTPGFGDSVRLAARLAQSASPIGWFLGEVWDRVRDRAFWSTQRAVRNVIERADVVLYLVDASDTPGDIAVIDAELRVLDLLHKPVIVLLNRLGAPRPAADQAAGIAVWRARLAGRPCVRQVLALDAFTRCWVQEGSLLQAVAGVLPDELGPAFARLQATWLARGQATWQSAVQVLARRLARAALDREAVTEADWSARLMDVGASLGLRKRGVRTAREQAMQRLAERLAADVRTSTDALIRLHGLGGHATDEVLAALADHFALSQPLDEGKAALWGGMASGALAGLTADLASGGLTLGGGLLAGGIAGALGAAGLARGYNRVRGVDTPTLAWSDAALDNQARAALLGYLAVAHFGRGRGDWTAAEQPRFWATAVDATLASHSEALHRLWRQRDTGGCEPQALALALHEWLTQASGELLQRLYPHAPPIARSAVARSA